MQTHISYFLARRSSSVAERFHGKKEVESPILSSGSLVIMWKVVDDKIG